MLTEVAVTKYAIKVNGQTLIPNIPSRSIAEATLYNLPQEQRALAEIVAITSDGKQALFG